MNTSIILSILIPSLFLGVSFSKIDTNNTSYVSKEFCQSIFYGYDYEYTSKYSDNCKDYWKELVDEEIRTQEFYGRTYDSKCDLDDKVEDECEL